MQDPSARRILLARMDRAFSDYSHEAEKLSVLLAEPADPSSWTYGRLPGLGRHLGARSGVDQ